MLKDLFDKGKCLVGIHQGEWQLDGSSTCSQTRICTVCSTDEHRTEHRWADWNYASNAGCEQRRRCARCREEETRLEHQWGAWAYDEAHRAPLKACERCGLRVSPFPRQVVEQSPRDPAAAASDGEEGFQTVHDYGADAVAFGRALLEEDPSTRQALFDEWLTARLPASTIEMLRPAFVSGALESRLLAACMLAEPHARGGNAPLGVAIGQAVCMAAESAYPETGSANHLTVLGNGARVAVIGYDAQSRYEDVIRAGRAATSWLDARGHKEAHPTLLMYCVDAHLQLDQLEEAGRLLAVVEQLPLPDTQAPDQRRRADLRRKFDALARRSATELAPERVDPDSAFRASHADLKQMVVGLREMDERMFGADSPFRGIVDTLTGDVQDDPANPAEWLQRTQGSRDALTEVLSGGAGEMNALRNRNRAINAAEIFSDPTKGHDPASIEASLAVLLEAREWARSHDCSDDENFALWGLYLCYSRTKREPQAIEVLQTLRGHLEAKRLQIADPMKRAGVFLEYPYLFGSLCRLLCGANRGVELLDAMEGAKGRVLADALTIRRGQAVADAAFASPIDDLVTALAGATAHYLSYFVDDEETYAVLVTKDGAIHSRSIALGKEQLRDLARSIDPSRWTRPRAGYFGKAAAAPERLTPLVAWLQPFLEDGTLSAGDHLCYSPDEYLHLVPLHYVHVGGVPLVRQLSVSRIHSVAAVTALLNELPARPTEFLAAQVPAQQDLGDAAKVAVLERVAEWLAEHASGVTLTRERATIEALSALDMTNRVVHFATHGVFPKDDIEGRNPNPFKSSGLALASDGRLPSLDAAIRGTSMEGLLTPERVLTLNVKGSHVTLQACVTGLAKEGIGGDALGLDLAFLLAGAQSLLTTHWDVSAHASADFSRRFYQKWLLEGATRAAAWRAAILELRDASTTGDLPGEYYWAAFSLSGDWR